MTREDDHPIVYLPAAFNALKFYSHPNIRILSERAYSNDESC